MDKEIPNEVDVVEVEGASDFVLVPRGHNLVEVQADAAG